MTREKILISELRVEKRHIFKKLLAKISSNLKQETLVDNSVDTIGKGVPGNVTHFK